MEFPENLYRYSRLSTGLFSPGQKVAFLDWTSYVCARCFLSFFLSCFLSPNPGCRDYPDSGSVYTKTDSGGECGVPYETYFQMPAPGSDKPWYSIASGPVHFTVMSTEHNWTRGSEQV